MVFHAGTPHAVINLGDNAASAINFGSGVWNVMGDVTHSCACTEEGPLGASSVTYGESLVRRDVILKTNVMKRRVHPCVMCPLRFRNERFLNIHLHKVHNKCPECPNFYETKTQKLNHMKKHYNNYCNVCKKKYKNKHVCEPSKGNFKCEQCSNMFTRYSSLKRHVLIQGHYASIEQHFNFRSSAYQCYRCKCCFDSIESFVFHVKGNCAAHLLHNDQYVLYRPRKFGM